MSYLILFIDKKELYKLLLRIIQSQELVSLREKIKNQR